MSFSYVYQEGQDTFPTANTGTSAFRPDSTALYVGSDAAGAAQYVTLQGGADSLNGANGNYVQFAPPWTGYSAPGDSTQVWIEMTFNGLPQIMTAGDFPVQIYFKGYRDDQGSSAYKNQWAIRDDTQADPNKYNNVKGEVWFQSSGTLGSGTGTWNNTAAGRSAPWPLPLRIGFSCLSQYTVGGSPFTAFRMTEVVLAVPTYEPTPNLGGLIQVQRRAFWRPRGLK